MLTAAIFTQEKDSLVQSSFPRRRSGVVAEINKYVQSILLPLLGGQSKGPLLDLSKWSQLSNFDDRLAIIELATPLEGLSGKRQANFFRRLINQVYQKSEWATHLKYLIPYLARFVSTEVKSEIIEKLTTDIELLGKRSKIRRSAEHLLEGFLNGVRNTEELSVLIARKDRFQRLADRGVSERVKAQLCIATIGPQLRTILFPTLITSHAPPKLVTQRLEEIRNVLKTAKEILAPYRKQFGDCWSFKQYSEWISHNSRYLEYACTDILNHPRKRRARVELVNFMLTKLRTENKAAILLAMPNGGKKLDPRQLPWDVKKVRAMAHVLKKIPERELHLTRRIFRICLFTSEGYWGWADSSSVRLEQTVFSSPKELGVNRHRRNLEGTLFHELGHVMPYYSNVESEVGPSALTWSIHSASGRNFLFDSYLKFHGWLQVPKSEFKLAEGAAGSGRRYVEIRGKEFPVDTPVILNGNLVSISVSSNGVKGAAGESSVFIRNAGARIPGSIEEIYNPFEEWSEGFRSYMQTPLELARYSPHLAYYFELIFRAYDGLPISGLGGGSEILRGQADDFFINFVRKRAIEVMKESLIVTELPKLIS